MAKSIDKLEFEANIDEYAVCLNCRLTVGEFVGRGEAWFNTSDILTFCDSLSRLASDMSGQCEIIGSNQKPDGSEYLELLGLRCYVLSASKLNGIIGIHASISHSPYTDCRKEEIQSVVGELQARNGHVREFANQLLKLAEGSQKQATLFGDLDRH